MLTEFSGRLEEELEDDEERMGYGEEAVKVSLAIALSLARQERGLSQQELADMVGFSKAYVGRLESGEANPSIAKAGRIFAALWLAPIDQPFPLVRGYGPYETARESAEEPPATGKEAKGTSRKAKR